MVDWNDLDDMILHAVEGNIDGEPIRILPRIPGEFSDFATDETRPVLDLIGTFSEVNAREKLRGDAIGINTNSYVAFATTVFTVRKSSFSSIQSWPKKDDAILRVGTNETFCISLIEHSGAAIKLLCYPEA